MVVLVYNKYIIYQESSIFCQNNKLKMLILVIRSINIWYKSLYAE